MKNSNISPSIYVSLFQCQPTSIAVERSFSILQNLLDDKKTFKKENVKKYMFLYYNTINK